MMNSYNLRWFRVLMALLFLSVGVGAQSWDSEQHSSEMRRKAERRYLPEHPKMPVFVIMITPLSNGHKLLTVMLLLSDITCGWKGWFAGAFSFWMRM